MNSKIKIGFIGQGWIGKNYANDFEKRGYDVVRYALEEPYVQNKDRIRDCEIVFIAVPTPTTQNGFDSTIVESSLALIGEGKIAVIKSTILPGTTERMQEKFPNIFVTHSPEFLREIYAAYDAENPTRNIVGIPKLNDIFLSKGEFVLSVLAKAPYNKLMHSKEAELVKYIGNCFLYQKVVFFNQMYDLAKKLNLDYQIIRDAVSHDSRIGESHTSVAHASGHNQNMVGRGAGGHCFIKDYEALIELYKRVMPEDDLGVNALTQVKEKNYSLLVNSQKDLDLLRGVAGGDLGKYKNPSKNYLVTGAAGFIGFATAERLLQEGHNVVGADNLNDYYDPRLKEKRLEILNQYENFEFHRIDFSKKESLFSVLSIYSIDAIFHLGAQAGVRYSIENPYAYAEANYIGTLNILEFAKDKKINHVLLASTSSVYGSNDKQPFEESDKADSPISTYAATKKGTELLAHTYSHLFGIKITVLRFFTVYGPWGRPDMALFKFVKNISSAKKIDVYNQGKMRRSFTYIDDIVSGLLGGLNAQEQYSIYNLGGGEVVELMHFISEIESALGKKADINFMEMQAGDMVETIASTKEAEKDLGYRAKTDIKTGITHFVKWFRENEEFLQSLSESRQ